MDRVRALACGFKDHKFPEDILKRLITICDPEELLVYQPARLVAKPVLWQDCGRDELE